MSLAGNPWVNKFEQVFSLDHHVSLAGDQGVPVQWGSIVQMAKSYV